jgi:hypothetical protein
MPKVQKLFGTNPEVVIIANKPVEFDKDGLAEIADEEQLAVVKEIEQATGQFKVVEESSEAEKAEEKPKKSTTKKK